jgi:hypothetical protein
MHVQYLHAFSLDVLKVGIQTTMLAARRLSGFRAEQMARM